MRRFASLAALIALLSALSAHAQAAISAPAPPVRLNAARMFDPAAESLLFGLFVSPDRLSPVNVVLFGAPSPDATAVPAPVPAASASRSISAVALHAYAPPPALPAAPAIRPSVISLAPLARPHLAQAAPRLQVPAAAPAPLVRFGSYTPYVPAVQSFSERVDVPVRVGNVHFSGIVSGAQAQTYRTDAVRAMQLCGTTDEAAACPYLHDEQAQNVAAGTAFNVRAGNTHVDLQLSGSVSRVSTRDTGMYRYTPLDPDTQLTSSAAGSPADGSLLYYPGLTDVVRHGLNARLAVPVSSAITIGLQYDRSHYQGNYGDLLAPGFDARKDTYLGNVTYQLPNSSSLITLSARQYRFQDGLTPNFNLTQTRTDLTFTVKF